MATKLGTRTVGDANPPTSYDSLPHRVGVGLLEHTSGKAEAFSSAIDQIAAAPTTGAPTSGQITVEHIGIPGGPVRTKVTLDAVSVALEDGAGGTNGGGGGQAILTFSKKGTIQLKGGRILLSSVAIASGTVAADATVDYGVGTAVATAGTGALAGTEMDAIVGVENDLVTSAAANQFLAADVTATSFDGNTTPPTLYFNISIATDADITGDAVLTVSATIYIDWELFPGEFLD